MYITSCWRVASKAITPSCRTSYVIELCLKIFFLKYQRSIFPCCAIYLACCLITGKAVVGFVVDWFQWQICLSLVLTGAIKPALTWKTACCKNRGINFNGTSNINSCVKVSLNIQHKMHPNPQSLKWHITRKNTKTPSHTTHRATRRAHQSLRCQRVVKGQNRWVDFHINF